MPTSLEEYHVKLEALMAEGDAVMAARDPSTAGMVRRRIAETTLVIGSYQLFVHREVFAPLLTRGDPGQRARANELKVECIALTEDLRVNVKDFMAKDGALDWDLTASQVVWFNGRVRKHIADVRELMSPTLSDADMARLRATRTGVIGIQVA